jgi:uncharacterized membrane protein
MITSSRCGKQLMIIVRPDQSSSWRTNKLMLLALAIPSLGAAILFALAGAWPILPLAGIELGALGTALYWVNRKLQYRQVITVNGDSITIDKGYEAPREHWQFKRDKAGIGVIPESHPWDAPSLSVHDRHECVQLGEFLSRDDTLRLLGLLSKEIRVRSNSKFVERHF